MEYQDTKLTAMSPLLNELNVNPYIAEPILAYVIMDMLVNSSEHMELDGYG